MSILLRKAGGPPFRIEQFLRELAATDPNRIETIGGAIQQAALRLRGSRVR